MGSSESESRRLTTLPSQPRAKTGPPAADLCSITSAPARYRDPATSLPFGSAAAFGALRATLAGRGAGAPAWSALLGCFVGPIGGGARGVPARFLRPNVVPDVGGEGRGGEAAGRVNDG